MKEKVRIAYIGLGRRGTGVLKECFLNTADVEITVLCDIVEKNMKAAADMLCEAGKPMPRLTTDYREAVGAEDVDAVVVMTSWESHFEIAMASMYAGKYTAIEVGIANDINECYKLIEAHEATGAPLMMLENICYGRRELAALRMVKEGLFGEIVHCGGAYHHYLNETVLFKKLPNGEDFYDRFRLSEYHSRCGELYPTHAFGPISKVLSLGRGNRMVSLTSHASCAKGLTTYIRDHVPESVPVHDMTFRLGDIVNTVITCAGGETILLTLDMTLPIPYRSRSFEVRGTKGCCIESNHDKATYFLEGMKEGVFDNEEEFFEKYEHPLHQEYRKNGAIGHHDGADYLVCRAFIEAVKAGTNTPIDAYDTVAWMAIGPLSEQSIAMGGAPVTFPDFTHGMWMTPSEPLKSKYSLDIICEDPDTPIVPQ